jgi:hypothetical protein
LLGEILERESVEDDILGEILEREDAMDDLIDRMDHETASITDQSFDEPEFDTTFSDQADADSSINSMDAHGTSTGGEVLRPEGVHGTPSSVDQDAGAVIENAPRPRPPGAVKRP